MEKTGITGPGRDNPALIHWPPQKSVILVTDRKASSHDNDTMKISPLDIRKKEFPVKLRGVDRAEVSSFLSLVREQMEELLREIAFLKEESAQRAKELDSYREIESELRNTVICTHEMTERYKQAAEKELEITLTDAANRADKIVKEAEKESVRLHEEIARLQCVRRNLRRELKLILDGHMNLLEIHDDIEHRVYLKTSHVREEEKGRLAPCQSRDNRSEVQPFVR